MSPDEFMEEYARRTNTHDFGQLAPLIAENAVYWFNDGSFSGLSQIRQVIEKPWAYIEEERYTIQNLQWLTTSEANAVCIYNFHWSGLVEGQLRQGSGRGTTVLNKNGAGQWQVVHEHLSPLPSV